MNTLVERRIPFAVVMVATWLVTVFFWSVKLEAQHTRAEWDFLNMVLPFPSDEEKPSTKFRSMVLGEKARFSYDDSDCLFEGGTGDFCRCEGLIERTELGWTYRVKGNAVTMRSGRALLESKPPVKLRWYRSIISLFQHKGKNSPLTPIDEFEIAGYITETQFLELDEWFRPKNRLKNEISISHYGYRFSINWADGFRLTHEDNINEGLLQWLLHFGPAKQLSKEVSKTSGDLADHGSGSD